MYCVCLVLELLILSLRILISKEARSTIVYNKEAETGKCMKIPLACSKGAILHLKSERPVLRGA